MEAQNLALGAASQLRYCDELYAMTEKGVTCDWQDQGGLDVGITTIERAILPFP